ncbi:MAG: transporter related protein [Chloroflexi bacterium]|nr:transporter related protein [Chloroflexota bacterium]
MATTLMERETGQAVIAISGLRKSYGKLTAVKHVDLEIRRGEVFGILGPNGAGKTTTLEMIEGLRKPDAGTNTVSGIDAVRQPARLKEIIGVQLQSTALFTHLTNFELLKLFSSFYQHGMTDRELEGLLAEVNLMEKKNSKVQELSGGQQQRLSIVLTLVNKPQVVFLDEPTTGLDPQARRNLWDLVRQINANGQTVVLTTHYMEEAETLCDRIAIMDHGEVLALDTPRGLINGLNLPPLITGSTVRPLPLDRVQALPGVQEARLDDAGFEIRTDQPQETLVGLLRMSTEQGLELSNLQVRSGNLEDVFINLTGRSLRS